MTSSSGYGSIPGNNGATAASGETAKDETTPLVNEEILSENTNAQHEKPPLWGGLVFNWFTPLLHRGNDKKKLDQADLYLVPFPDDCTTAHVTDAFDKYWQAELEASKAGGLDDNNKRKREPSLVRALFYAFGASFMKAGFLKLINDCLTFVGPLVLNAMIYYLRDAHAPHSRGLALTALVTMSQLCMSFCLRHYFFQCYLTGLRIRTAIVTAVYKKALVLSSGERQMRTVGEITNLMTIDAERLQGLTTYLHAIWYAPIQIFLALYFLWGQLGPSCLGGVAIMIIVMPLTKTVAMRIGKIQKVLMQKRDERVDINSEVLGSMKCVKLQAWEEAFQERIMAFRNTELNQLLRYWLFSSATGMLWNSTPLMVALATFFVYVVTSHDLEVASALTALSLFDILRFPIFMLPQIINTIAEASVSFTRVQSFLLCDEQTPMAPGDLTDVGIQISRLTAAYESKKTRVDDVALAKNPAAKELADKDWEVQLLRARLEVAEREIRDLKRGGSIPNRTDSVMMDNVPVQSDVEGDAPLLNLLCLKRVNFRCNRGELIAVCGAVGSGKSSFINSILGEVKQLTGAAYVKGSLAYFAQTPFILNATVKDNILFGHTQEAFDKAKYKRALDACALKHDLKLLDGGDMTEIGEKGITLSGGQKARVALARACYHEADISLIDDALSAVDAHVAKHLFDKCIVDELMQDGRSVILATNALQFLNHDRVSRIIVMKDGCIAEEGSYRELMARENSLFAKFVAVINETGVNPGELDDSALLSAATPQELVASPSARRSSVRMSVTEDQQKSLKNTNQLMTEEARAVGHVTLSVYLSWAAAAGGYWVPFILLLLFSSVEFINVGTKWWLTYWSSHGETASQMWFLGIYALINLSSVVAGFLCFICAMLFGLKASRKMFYEMLDVVLRAPMSFFDTTPIGRIVNRFSKDIYTIDEVLVMTLRTYMMTLMSVVSTIVVISGVTPVFTACLIPIIFIYINEQAFFTITYRELKRLDSVNRSPLFALLGETIDGVATIRAFSAQRALFRRMTSCLDVQQHAYYLTSAALCWLAVRLELIGTSIITCTCFLAVFEHNKIGDDRETQAGLYGLAISYALSVTQALNWSVRMASDFEANMVAVERVKDYTNIASEADRYTPADKAALASSWPARGEVEFKDAKLRYRPGLPLVLKGLTIHIPGGSKVGVVGRTGAGKSTLMTALLRIVELAEGQILIDGVDIRSLGLATLRSKIAVIPQDPVLFTGSIKSNLDPFDAYSDEILFGVLNRVGLYDASPSKKGSATSLSSLGQGAVESLTDPVSEGGINFSVGQRQLLVIARALLCGASIVIMDEATASVDADTDARIQQVLRTEFVSATCLTVAHRLNTIMESDYILVMDDGRAAEFDPPKTLLSRGGMFRDLVAAASLES